MNSNLMNGLTMALMGAGASGSGSGTDLTSDNGLSAEQKMLLSQAGLSTLAGLAGHGQALQASGQQGNLPQMLLAQALRQQSQNNPQASPEFTLI